MIDLGTLGGPGAYNFNGNVTGATAINDRGQVTGGATYNAVIDPACGSDAQPAGAACNHAFLWERGVMSDLGTLGGMTRFGNSFSVGNAINDRGQIVGFGVNPNGQFDTFLLTPSQGHGPGVDARTEVVLAARAHAALATLPAAIRRHLGLHNSGSDGA